MADGPKGPMVPEYKTYNIPWEWRHIICMCPEDKGTKSDDEVYGPYLVCRECGKYKRFYASRCSQCGEFYLMTFICRAWNPIENSCWSCLTHDDTCVPPMPIVTPRRHKTEEEIEADLDSLFVVDLENSVNFDF